MKGVILGINLYDYKSQLKKNDLVFFNETFYNLENIDPRFNKKEDEQDTESMYILKNVTTGNLMNFKRKEISKCTISVFDYDKYYNENKKINLGLLSVSDLKNIKSKHAIEWNIPTDQIDSIPLVNVLELSFEGTVQTQKINNEFPDSITSNSFSSNLNFFKINN